MDGLDSAHHAPIHRIIAIDASAGQVAASMADNLHQFSVDIWHQDGLVTSVVPNASRVPWTTCPGSLARLQDLVGVPLEAALPATIDKALQCTHLFDLARLAMSLAQRIQKRRYDVHIAAGPTPDTIDARVLIDDATLLHWTVSAGRVVSAGPFLGHRTAGPADWPDGVDDPDIRRAALMLRRALLVFLGSARSLGTLQASELPYMAGVCHSFQADQMALARRPAGFRLYPAEAVEMLARD